MFGSSSRFEPLVPGQPISVRPHNAAFGLLEALSKLQVEPPLQAIDVGGTPLLRFVRPDWLRIAQTGAGGIPARSGATLGQAAVTLQRINVTQSGTTLTATLATDTTETCFNWAGTAVGASRYILVFRMTNVWIVLEEDCP